MIRLASTQVSALKRPLKKVVNLLRDPLPRNRELVFEDYELRLPEIVFTFSTNGKRYNHTARIELPAATLGRLNRREHHGLFVNLGLSFVACNFLLSDFARVNIRCASLDSRDAKLLEDHLLDNLTEFRYLAGLDPARRIEVVATGTESLQPIAQPSPPTRALLLNGGGKDSCASAELVKGSGLEFAWLNCFPNGVRERVMAASGESRHFNISFAVDDELKHNSVYGWGIAPYVYAIHAAGLIVAYLENYRYLVSGSEHSADDPNLVFNGVEVNHQATKSIRFENFFNTFVERNVLDNAGAFSVARPFTDLRLAEIFSHHPQYFPAFFSCNVAMGTDKWCNRCHKCAFTYLALYPFMELTDLDAIFGERLFELADIRRQVIELATAKIKPWECVGTVEESQLALAISLRKSPQMDFAEAPRRADLERACAGLDIDAACSNTLGTFLGPHNLPDFLEGKVQNYSEQLLTTTLQRDPELWPASLRQRALAA